MKRKVLIALFPVLTACDSAYYRGVLDRVRAPSRAQFADWLEESGNEETYHDLMSHLEAHDVIDVVPVWHLLRQGTDWRQAELSPFAMPPRDKWDNIVPTLELIRDEVVPRVGEVEVVSSFRTNEYNKAAGGTWGSRHRYFEAVDLVPVYFVSKEEIHESLNVLYDDVSDSHSIGLGIYSGARFHIDSFSTRRW
jgi:uncharacterized protein YcbK (DUF882 family)